jgi:putative chitinase
MDMERFRVAAGLPAVMAGRWWPHVDATWREFDISTPARQSAWIAQVGHESGGFVFTRELWGPTAAQQRYEGRIDLGNTQPGDGKRFMGRGLIQITGRANYQACGAALGVDLETNPVLLQGDALAARSAGWFWQWKALNQFADAGDFVGLTRRINGGTNGLADRQMRWERARRALGIQ